jgi:predicted oxidoreductase (fatty acid repression mutant protein)
MDNGNKPAFSVALRDNGNALHSETMGLTKREYFAGLAMQGICANVQHWSRNTDDIMRASIRMADELLKELKKQQ